MNDQEYVVITRPVAESEELRKKLEEFGFTVFSFPSITILKNSLTLEVQKALKDVDSFDWIIFTSRNGVRYFMDALKELHVTSEVLLKKHIAAVGPKTADEAKKYNLPVHVIPSEFTTEDLANALIHIEGKKILLPRANIATPLLAEQLEKKGALVTNIAIYNTEFTATPYEEFEELLHNKKIICLTFTSPSTVKGFLQNIQPIKDSKNVFSLPVISIGPVTAKALQTSGFHKIYTADTFTIEGIVSKIRQNIL